MKNKLIAACVAVFSAFYSCDNACGSERAAVNVIDRNCATIKENARFRVGLYAGTDWSPLDSKAPKTYLMLEVTDLNSYYDNMIAELKKQKSVKFGPAGSPREALFSCDRRIEDNDTRLRLQNVFTWRFSLDDLLQAHMWKDSSGNYTKFFEDVINSGCTPAIELKFKPEARLELHTVAHSWFVKQESKKDDDWLNRQHRFIVSCNAFDIQMSKYYDLDSFKVTPEIQKAADELKDLARAWGLDMEVLKKAVNMKIAAMSGY